MIAQILNKVMPENPSEVEAAFSSTYAIASVGIATLDMLETLLPAAANEVEIESQALSDCFMTLASYIESQGPDVPKPVKDALYGVVTGMQFQDRNTQVMENTVGILERYRNMLEGVCRNIEAMRATDAPFGHDVTHAVEHILSGIRLSDIRSRYMQALKKAQVHAHGIHDAESVSSTDDIELF